MGVSQHDVAALLDQAAGLLSTLAVGGPLLAMKYKLASTAANEARQQADLSSRNLQQLLTDSIYRTVEALENTPGSSALHRTLLDDTTRLCDKVLYYGTEDPEMRFGIARSFVLYARVEDLLFDKPTAAPRLETAIAILNDLVQQHSTRAEFRFELAQAHFWLGVNEFLDLPRSEQHFRTAIALLEPLEASASSADRYSVTRDYSQSFLGNVLEHLGAKDEAERHYRSARTSSKNRLKGNLQNAELRKPWILAKLDYADLAAATGRLDEAAAEFQECVTVLDPFLDEARQNTRSRIFIAESLWGEFGDVQLSLRNPQAAEALHRKAVVELESVLEGLPGNNWGRTALLSEYLFLSDTLLAQQRFDDALAALRKAWVIEPSSWIAYRQGLVHWWAGRRQEANVQMRRAITHLMAQNDNDRRLHLLRKAVVFATCPCEELRNSQLALEFARQSFHPQDGGSWRLMAISQYRSGDMKAARDSLAEAIRHLNGGDAFESFLDALVCHALGNHEEARRRYDQALTRVNGPLIRPSLEHAYVTPFDLDLLHVETEQVLKSPQTLDIPPPS